MSRKIATLIGAGIMGGATTNPMLADLASYWTLDEGSGNRLDSVGTRHMVPIATVGSTTGKIGNCATLSGAGNYLRTADLAELTSLNWAGGFTIAGWLYIPDPYTSRNGILCKEDNTIADWSFWTENASSLRFQVGDSVSGFSTANNAVAISVDTWHFVAARYNPSTKKAEVRMDAGAWQLGAAISNAPKNTKISLRVGNYLSAYGKAYYDELGLWLAYKDDAFMDYLYNGGAGRTLNPT